MKIDFHIHTNFSYDGFSSPQEVVDSSISKGIDCICITDHRETKGAIEALRFAFSKPILIIPGIEIKSREGDVLGINIKEIIPDGLSAEETIRRINELGGLAVIAHPFAWLHYFKGNLEKIIAGNPNFFIAVEVFNASVSGFSNKKAFRLAQNNNLPSIAGSDAHGKEFVGRGFMEIPGENLSIEEILEEIRGKKGEIKKESVSFFEKMNWRGKKCSRNFKNNIIF